jgi:hypothetical protein
MSGNLWEVAVLRLQVPVSIRLSKVPIMICEGTCMERAVELQVLSWESRLCISDTSCEISTIYAPADCA